ncbi:DUF2779 domain-containing protein [bacterium]|nr:DUF2779 domain-containing protein [bacterium]
MKARAYLTKSVFKIGLECPRKLFYHNKPEEYLNDKTEDPFLAALARGGYQVGALATLKYPSGIEIKTHKHADAISETAQNLKNANSILFEAAFSSDPLFVRSDIAIKADNMLRIIEVKSKSTDSDDDGDEFISPKFSKPGLPKLYAKWIPYIYDLAFQVLVARLNYPDLKVSASLMLLDKSQICTEDGLHQMFRIKKLDDGKQVVLTKKPDQNFKGFGILKEIDLTALVDEIIDGKETSEFHISGNLTERASKLSEIYIKNQKFPISQVTGTHCKKCEFRGSSDVLKSGFDECWIEFANIQAASSKVMSFDLWNYKGSEKALDNKKYLLSDLDEEDLGKPGPTSERQLLQIEQHKSGSKIPFLDLRGLSAEIDSWKWPLHFIDFETCTPAIPFMKGFSPYSELAFQFSHHIMEKDGSVRHAGEFIDLQPGSFPTFNFLRALHKELSNDNGTIFRYSSHENSVINRALFLLEKSDESDKKELTSFFKTITNKKASKKKDDYLWKGNRNMVDLLELVKKHYLSPLMGSSNSLKYVLPAVLNESSFLKQKYSVPVYGTEKMHSINFKDHAWIKKVGNDFTSDPYKELPPLFSPEDEVKIESIFSEENEINNGGAAMMAYCYTQFTEMSDIERERIRSSLLKYCELDTLAMVMLVEYWRDVIK